MPLNRRLLLRISILFLALLGLSNFYTGITLLLSSTLSSFFSATPPRPSRDTLRNLGLTDEQCRGTFPGLMNEIDSAVERERGKIRDGGEKGGFQLKREPGDYTGLVQGAVRDGKLYIISVEKSPSRDMLFERTAVLHQLHRALLTSPSSEPLPNTTFTFTILDTPHSNSWSFARSNDPLTLHPANGGTNPDANYWLMPHFSGWSWPLPFLGAGDEVLGRIEGVEERFLGKQWERKTGKVVWRGTAWFNGVGNTDLRPKLLGITKGKEWADVQDLQWVGVNGQKASNSLAIEEFCGYKYVIYTEGITYSGRLPFHQACASVILTPPPNYLLHTTHLMRPIFSSTLLRPHGKSEPNPRWPKEYPASEANIVFVDPDWKDLEATVMWLREHDAVAKGIARQQREMYVGGGYLSEAAETCYWRALVRGWSEVARPVDGWGLRDGDGVRWETFSLTGKVGWD